jgi:hypothetical protein
MLTEGRGFMPNAAQIRSRLAAWIDGGISLSEFEDWFVPETWNIHQANDAEADDLVDEIELSLSEYSGGFLSQSQLKETLKGFINRPSTSQSGMAPVADAPVSSSSSERL